MHRCVSNAIVPELRYTDRVEEPVDAFIVASIRKPAGFRYVRRLRGLSRDFNGARSCVFGREQELAPC